MSKAEYTEILQSAFTQGTPFINFTEYYSYALIPQGGNWLEISYDFEDHEVIEKNEIPATKAYAKFCEEIEKAMSAELELFYLNKWVEFKSALSGSEEENLNSLIQEFTSNTDTYGKDIPIVRSEADISKVIEKL